ncbi:hypothetical protein GCM10007162_11670 [Ignatzschineria ureiclastica]|nr:hypothetical protein GCM10007162_11670 [Ignatzschineria ureiclastica]
MPYGVFSKFGLRKIAFKPLEEMFKNKPKTLLNYAYKISDRTDSLLLTIYIHAVK